MQNKEGVTWEVAKLLPYAQGRSREALPNQQWHPVTTHPVPCHTLSPTYGNSTGRENLLLQTWSVLKILLFPQLGQL